MSRSNEYETIMSLYRAAVDAWIDNADPALTSLETIRKKNAADLAFSAKVADLIQDLHELRQLRGNGE
jgi:hypothetical protein